MMIKNDAPGIAQYVPAARFAISQALSSRRRGRSPQQSTKVIAFSLWGDSPAYWVGALRNIRLANTYYPGWFCRFYVDCKASREHINSLEGENVEVFLMKRYCAFDGMFWRFSAASDPNVSIAVFRDCDSRIRPREAAAVNAWLQSGKEFHIMRDHPYHAVPILGGMWGCRTGRLPNLGILIACWAMTNWRSLDHKGCDQVFLAQRIYPLMTERALEHSEFDLHYGNPTIPFPSERQDSEFVGEIFDDHDRRHEEHHRVMCEACR
jgi:hypothetical protein